MHFRIRLTLILEKCVFNLLDSRFKNFQFIELPRIDDMSILVLFSLVLVGGLPFTVEPIHLLDKTLFAFEVAFEGYGPGLLLSTLTNVVKPLQRYVICLTRSGRVRVWGFSSLSRWHLHLMIYWWCPFVIELFVELIKELGVLVGWAAGWVIVAKRIILMSLGKISHLFPIPSRVCLLIIHQGLFLDLNAYVIKVYIVEGALRFNIIGWLSTSNLIVLQSASMISILASPIFAALVALSLPDDHRLISWRFIESLDWQMMLLLLLHLD